MREQSLWDSAVVFEEDGRRTLCVSGAYQSERFFEIL